MESSTAVAFHVPETMVAAYPDRFYASDNMRVVEAGKRAIFIKAEDGTSAVDPEVAAPFAGRRPDRGAGARAPWPWPTSTRRMLEGVVAEAQDIDPCMILRWRLFWLGGITPYPIVRGR